MSITRQEQDRQVAELKAEHPELEQHNLWTCVKGKMVPYHDAKQNVKLSLPVKNSLLGKVKYFECLQNETALLLYLLKHRPFKGKQDGKHKTSSVWYHQKGLIVASVGVEKMSKDLGVDERRIRRWTRRLREAGLIRTFYENREAVYVLGEIIKGEEVFFYAKQTKVIKMKDYLL
jgi:hypothetical protein